MELGRQLPNSDDMSEAELTKVAAKTAAEIWAQYEPSAATTGFRRNGQTPRQFVDLLIQAGQYLDAIDFLAHALPKREAVWWACLGVRHALGTELPPQSFAALKAAVEWVLEPDEPRRRAAEAAGEAADFSTPAGCAALAVFGSGGSLTPANLPEVPPEPFMTAKAVAGSVAMASLQCEPPTLPDLQRELVELGLAIAEGKVTWPDAPTWSGSVAKAAEPPSASSPRERRV